MSRDSTASTSVAAATKFILAASQKGFSVFIEGKLSIESSERNPKSSVVTEWTNNHDLALAREVLLLEPFRLKARTVERGRVWQTIADNLNSHATLRFLVTKKSVREHLKLLLDKYRARMQKERRDSGVEVEQTELDQALEINEKWEAADEQDILLLNNRKTTEEDRAMGEEVRKKACEKLGETMKRKGEGEGSSEPKKKRSRKGGNDTIEFLREKANIDMAMKQEEQKARREEHERQTRLYELALANQQQQQQQSNQLMSLMFGLMQKIAEK